MTRGRLLVFRLIVVTASCLLVLGALEVAVRLKLSRGNPVDSAIKEGKLTPPGEPEFRPPLPRMEKEEGAYRVVVVGDSYTFGDGVYVEDSYPYRLQVKLEQAYPQRRIEVVPWARRGWNTAQQLRSIRPHFDELDADLLIIGFTLNDTEQMEPGARSEARAEILPKEPASPLSRLLCTHSALFDRLWKSLENIRMRGALARYYRDLHGSQPGVTECRKALKNFHRMTRSRDIPMMLVVFPIFDSQLDHRYRYRQVHANIADRIGRMNIKVVDLLPYFEGIDGRRLAVTPFTDPHPNELAHRIATDAIIHNLKRNKMLPEPASASR